MMRKLAFPLAVILLLAGCFSTPGKRYFQIVPMEKNAQPLPAIGRTLYIEPVRVDPLYDDFRVLYRVSPFELRYYSTVYWAKKPSDLMREAMSGYLLRGGVFSRVMMDVLQGDPNLVLRTTVRCLEEIDNPKVWFGRLALDIEFLDFKSGEVLARHSFDRRLPLGAQKSEFLPAVVSRILAEEMDLAVGKLAGALKAK